MKHRLIFALLLLLAGSALRAADAPPAPVTDPAQVGERFRQISSAPKFHETEEADVNAEFRDWLSHWFLRLGARIGHFKYASRMPAFESLLMTALVALAVSGLIYTLVRLTRGRGRMEAEPVTDLPGEKIFRPPESYDREIHEAIRTENWHAAWLASWRQFLSRLENHHLVEADRTRTNREYLAQLLSRPLPASALAQLSGMVDAYDRFIYGRQRIDESDWNFFHRQINETALLLDLNDKSVASRIKGGAL